MHDAYVARAVDIDACLAAFQAQPGQRCILVTVNGRVLGLDLFSNADIYAKVHTRLLKSYIIESLAEAPKPPAENTVRTRAEAFLAAAAACEESVYPSVGLGHDHRLRNDDVLGSALVHEDEVVHAAFFTNDEQQEEPPLAGARHRRNFRRRAPPTA
jgi:hypothetical protein